MRPSSGQLPHQPGIHRAERKTPRPSFLPGSTDVVEQPLQLGGTEVGIDDQPGAKRGWVRSSCTGNAWKRVEDLGGGNLTLRARAKRK